MICFGFINLSVEDPLLVESRQKMLNPDSAIMVCTDYFCFQCPCLCGRIISHSIVEFSSSNIRFKFANINVSNVAMNLSSLKVSKATEMDNLPAKILKISSYLIAPSLTAIFNMSLKFGIYI